MFIEVPASAALIAFMVWGILWAFQHAQNIQKTGLEIDNLKLEKALKEQELRTEELKQSNKELLADPDVVEQLKRISAGLANSILLEPVPYKVEINGTVVYDEDRGRGGPQGARGGKPLSERPPARKKSRKPNSPSGR